MSLYFIHSEKVLLVVISSTEVDDKGAVQLGRMETKGQRRHGEKEIPIKSRVLYAWHIAADLILVCATLRPRARLQSEPGPSLRRLS